MCTNHLKQIMLCCLMMAASVSQLFAVTATWDFKNLIPSSLNNLCIQGGQDHVGSDQSGISMFVIAKEGKFHCHDNMVQVNAKTTLRVPVKSTKDVVTVTSFPNYHAFTVGGATVTADVTSHTATADEVSKGYVAIAAQSTTYLLKLQVVQNASTSGSSTQTNTTTTVTAKKITALWDFQHVNPSALSGLTIQGKQGHIPSTVNDVSIYCIGQYGKFSQRTSDAQVNAKTTLRVPVTSTKDVVTVKNYPGYHSYNVGGVAATADETSHTATQAEVEKGYVEIFTTDNCYLYSIQTVLNQYKGSDSKATTTTGTSDSSNNSSSSGSSSSITPAVTAQNFYLVKAGSASSFLDALKKANASNASASAARAYIFLPDGTYDLGSTCLTAITGHNISIIGQSMNGTIIKNKPKQEGIGVTATLLNKGKNNYLQDLTLQNAFDFYNNTTNAGRAVCLQDQGDHTICKNVKMLSYQDTYYTHTRGSLYLEDSDIHGVVDFICGGGDVFFNKCTITCEKRNKENRGGCTITAPNVDASNKWGYVFDGCTIVNYSQNYNYGRAWGGQPRCIFLNTIHKTPNTIASSRWTTQGMNVAAYKFGEYRSVDASGKVISPTSLRLTFTHSSGNRTMETILSQSEAANYALSKVFASWKPQNQTVQVKMGSLSQNGSKLQWSKVSGASSYAIFKDNKIVAIVGNGTSSYNMTATGTYTVRASNTMGGFGLAATLKVSSLGASTSSTTTTSSSAIVSGYDSNYDQNAPIGWATVGGKVTGSSDKSTVVVSTLDQLKNALAGTDQKTIFVKGTINFDGALTMANAQNKTIYGLKGAVLQNTYQGKEINKTGILTIKNCKNIIVRNLTFKGPGAYDIDGRDNLLVTNSTYIWIDHCDFQDGVDCNFDCNAGSNNLAVTWCRFRFLKDPRMNPPDGGDHRFSNLWGSADNITTDKNKLNTTFANCWWDEGCKQRMARVRYGKIHFLNCLYSSSIADYCIGAGYLSNIYVEKCAFTSAKTQKTPWRCMATSNGYTDYNITLKGNQGASDVQKRSGSQGYFTPSGTYGYKSYDASKVQSVVSKYAGATLTINVPSSAKAKESTLFEEGLETTGILSAEADQEAVSTEIFNAAGSQTRAVRRGVNIIRRRYADGTVKTIKVMAE